MAILGVEGNVNVYNTELITVTPYPEPCSQLLAFHLVHKLKSSVLCDSGPDLIDVKFTYDLANTYFNREDIMGKISPTCCTMKMLISEKDKKLFKTTSPIICIYYMGDQFKLIKNSKNTIDIYNNGIDFTKNISPINVIEYFKEIIPMKALPNLERLILSNYL